MYGTYELCEAKDKQFKDVAQTITMNKQVFSKINRKNTTKNVDLDENEYGDWNEEEIDELENEQFMESEASRLVQEGDINVIKTGDNHPYYLHKLFRDPF